MKNARRLYWWNLIPNNAQKTTAADGSLPYAPLTSYEVYKRMQGNVDMSMRMVRVLMNRLNQKDILGYTVDEHDSRVYSETGDWQAEKEVIKNL